MPFPVPLGIHKHRGARAEHLPHFDRWFKVRRGRCVQIQGVEEEQPVLVEAPERVIRVPDIDLDQIARSCADIQPLWQRARAQRPDVAGRPDDGLGVLEVLRRWIACHASGRIDGHQFVASAKEEETSLAAPRHTLDRVWKNVGQQVRLSACDVE